MVDNVIQDETNSILIMYRKEFKMRKIPLLVALTALTVSYATLSQAHDWGHEGHHHHHHHGHGHHGWGGGWRNQGYYPQPQANNYYPQPPVNYYPPQPRYQPDPRNHQGLAGGVIGSVFGYEIGQGDPIAAGLGAAAGSFIGNSMHYR
jgi:hypothetical protein